MISPAAHHYLTWHMLSSPLNELSPVRVWAVYTLYTSHATTWQLFTERSRIYRYLVFGMKFIEFISVVRAIYLVVIFVIAGCSNGNSYTATPPSLRPPHTHLTRLMLNDTKTRLYHVPCFSQNLIILKQNKRYFSSSVSNGDSLS